MARTATRRCNSQRFAQQGVAALGWSRLNARRRFPDAQLREHNNIQRVVYSARPRILGKRDPYST
jgi:hypothetical protein